MFGRRSFLASAIAFIAAPWRGFMAKKPVWMNYTRCYTHLTRREIAQSVRAAMEHHEFKPPVSGK